MTYRDAMAAYVLAVALENRKRLTFKHFLKIAGETDKTGSILKFSDALRAAYENRKGKTAQEIWGIMLNNAD